MKKKLTSAKTANDPNRANKLIATLLQSNDR